MNGNTNKNKCRTCLKSNTKLKLLNTKPKMLKVNKTYMELLKYVTNIEIDTDDDEGNVTPGICCTCCKRIRESYAFIKQVHKCNKHFTTDNDDPVENTSLAKLKESLTKQLPKCSTSSVGHEEPLIKQEIVHVPEDSSGGPKQEVNSDRCSSVSSNDYFDDLVPTLGTNKVDIQPAPDKSQDSFADVDIKMETEQKNDLSELHPVCVLTEPILGEEDNVNTDYDDSCKIPSSSGDDPLDSEAFDETNNKDAPADDKMLPVRCNECEKVFPNSLILNRHKKDTHIPDELKIQCPNCPVKFSRRYNMYAHMRTFHKSETVREHQIQPRKLVKTDVCEHCNRSYSDKYKLMAHIKSKHGPDSPPKKKKQPPKLYLCTLCGLTCSSQSNLDIHYRRHTGEKPFKCDFCGRAYARLYDVQVHRRIHTGETPFKCTICEKAFKRSNKLKIHMRTHTNERPYKCTQCEKAFKQSKDLNIHKRTHTGERPYKCGVCLSTFTQSNSLKLHQTKTKHFEVSMAEAEFNDITNTLS